MKFNTIVIIFLFLAAVIVGLGVWKLTRVDNKQVNPDVPTKCYGDECKFDCGVLNPNTVVRCKKNLDGSSICSKCKCDASGRLSGCMECQDTDPNDPKTVIRNGSIKIKSQCIDPFFWDEKEGTCKLSKGSYCLPARVDDITCNPYTGNKVLQLDEKTNAYRWGCVCKNDLKFSGNTCSNINVCGLEGESQNPNNSLGRGLLKAGTNDVYWNNNSDWDPLGDGNSQCSCRSNEVADNSRLLCLPNSCSPGAINTNDPSGQSCICDPDQGLVDCYEISTSYDGIAPYYNGACKFPSCVPDPCAGDGKDGINGQYKIKYDSKSNAIGGNCVCRKGKKLPNGDDDPNDPTYHLVPDPNAYGGFSCKQLCIDNGPCGNRGTCKVQDLDKAFTQFTIRCKDMDKDGECTSSLFMIIYNSPSSIKSPSSTPYPSFTPYPSSYYLNYYKDNGKLILEQTQNPYSFFSFKLKKCKVGDNNQPDCTDTTTSNVDKGLNSSSYYYIMIGDKYLSFNPSVDGTYNLVEENDSKKEGSLFLFLSQEGNKRPLANATGTMFFPHFQKYLSINTKDRSITYDPVSKTQEYCDPCNDGWIQDPNDDTMRCQLNCFKSGERTRASNSDTQFTDEQIKSLCCSGKGDQTPIYIPSNCNNYSCSQDKYWEVICR